MRDHQICPSPLCDHHGQCRSAMLGEPCLLDKLWQAVLDEHDSLNKELAETMPFEPHKLPTWRPDWVKFLIAGLVSLWWIAFYSLIFSIRHLFH